MLDLGAPLQKLDFGDTKGFGLAPGVSQDSVAHPSTLGPCPSMCSQVSSFLAPPVLWAGVWFVAFCFLASQWQHSKSKHFLLGSSSAKAAIAFSFFSVPVWVRTSPGPTQGGLGGLYI